MLDSRHRVIIIQCLVIAIVLIPLSACSLSLIGDVTPPPNFIYPGKENTPQDASPLPDQSSPQAEDQPTAMPQVVSNISITGKVFMPGAIEIPEGLTADLQRFQMTGMRPELLHSAQVQSDGSYQFENISLDPNQLLIITVIYNRATFMSQMIAAAGLKSGELVDLPVTIYETSNDTSVLVAERAHFYFDLLAKDRLQVLQLFIITNPSRYYVLPPWDGAALIDFLLPDDAVNLQFEEQTHLDRFKITATGFSNLESIPPNGQIQIIFAYEVPFEASTARSPVQWFTVTKKSLSIPVPVKIKSAVVMAPKESLQLENPQLVKSGTRDLQGMIIQVYTTGNMQAGSNFDLTIKNRRPTGMAGGVPGIGLAVGLIVFIVSVGFAIHWIFRRPQMVKKAAAQEQSFRPEINQEALVDSILALDDLYTSGKIAPQTYHERRAQLKEQLRILRRERSD